MTTNRRSDNRAVIIGAAEYDDPDIESHESIAASARAMARWLDTTSSRRSGRWPPISSPTRRTSGSTRVVC